MKPNGAREIAEKTALVRAGHESAYANGHDSCMFVHAANADELRAAIAVVTRAIASARESKQVLELVRERAAMRHELEALQNGTTLRPQGRVA